MLAIAPQGFCNPSYKKLYRIRFKHEFHAFSAFKHLSAARFRPDRPDLQRKMTDRLGPKTEPGDRLPTPAKPFANEPSSAATLICWVNLHGCYRHLIVKQQDAQAPC
jgi:hypothetical protein